MKTTAAEKSDATIPIYSYYDKGSFVEVLFLIGNILSVGSFIGLIIACMIGFDKGFALHSTVFSVVGVFTLISFWFIRTTKSSYEIYYDRIDFFSVYKPTEREVVKINEIFQARYEDGFKQGVYLYLNKDHTSKVKRIKQNRIGIRVGSANFINDLITILKFFQTQKKQVYISTKKKEINLALDLENWIEPPYANNKLIEMFLGFFR